MANPANCRLAFSTRLGCGKGRTERENRGAQTFGGEWGLGEVEQAKALAEATNLLYQVGHSCTRGVKTESRKHLSLVKWDIWYSGYGPLITKHVFIHLVPLDNHISCSVATFTPAVTTYCLRCASTNYKQNKHWGFSKEIHHHLSLLWDDSLRENEWAFKLVTWVKPWNLIIGNWTMIVFSSFKRNNC